MEPDCEYLAPARWQRQRLFLLRAADALRMCSGGSAERLKSHRAKSLLADIHAQDLPKVRMFLAHARLPVGDLRRFGDTALLPCLRRLVDKGDLVIVRIIDGQAMTDATVEQRRLVLAIEAQSRNKLSHQGRILRLVPGAKLALVEDRDDYQVVSQGEARKILAGLAQTMAGTNPALGKLLDEAATKITPDWRPPFLPDGLVLLCRVPRVAPSGVDAPALTPSQIKQQTAKTEWIEIEVHDELGKPYTGAYKIQLPDGTFAEGNFDETGLWGDYDIDPGQCKMIVPEPSESTLPGTGTDKDWIAFRLVDDLGQPLVGWGFRFTLADKSERTGTTSAGETRVDKVVAGTCVLVAPVETGPAPNPAGPGFQEEDPEDVAAGILDGIIQDQNGAPIANQAFEAHFPDGTVMKGQTDGEGRLHLENCPDSHCTLQFHGLDG
jgi:hypothetical protein